MKKTFIAIAILGLVFTSCSQYDKERIEDSINSTAKSLGYEDRVITEDTPEYEEEWTLEAQREREAYLMSDEYTPCAWCGEERPRREMDLDNKGNDFCSRKCKVEYMKSDYE
jgi:hypothetical protein